MSLVSDGAEAVLIHKKFFLQHLTDDLRRKLRATVIILYYFKDNQARSRSSKSNVTV